MIYKLFVSSSRIIKIIYKSFILSGRRKLIIYKSIVYSGAHFGYLVAMTCRKLVNKARFLRFLAIF